MAVKLSPKRAAIAAAARAERMKILESGLPMGDLPEPEGRGDETKQRILDTSITLFAERGFEACTMRDIAAAVGIKAPAIYNHYDSKEDVLAAAMEHILGRFYSSQLAPLEEKPVESWLKLIVRGHVRFQLEFRRLAHRCSERLDASAPPAVQREDISVGIGCG
jgi:AcrR family transcriptional regulator